MKLLDMVRDGKLVTFSHFRAGALWYRTDDGFEFPVPIADTGGATFLAQDKALLFMRYVRAHLATIATERGVAAQHSTDTPAPAPL